MKKIILKRASIFFIIVGLASFNAYSKPPSPEKTIAIVIGGSSFMIACILLFIIKNIEKKQNNELFVGQI